MSRGTAARARAWEAYFTTTSRLADRLERRLKAGCSLSLPEYNVLLQVQRAGSGGIRPSALAHEVVFSPSRLTHTLDRLGRRGLLERRACDTDGRGGQVHLTPAGRSAFDEAARVHRALVRDLVLDDLEPGEDEVLERVFTRIARRLDEDS